MSKILQTDVNLSLEGPASRISRKQAILKRCINAETKKEEFFITNTGKLPMYVDGSTVVQGNKARLFDSSIIEIAQIRLKLEAKTVSSPQPTQTPEQQQQQQPTTLPNTVQSSSSALLLPLSRQQQQEQE